MPASDDFSLGFFHLANYFTFCARVALVFKPMLRAPWAVAITS
jgi:hypothetical protein